MTTKICLAGATGNVGKTLIKAVEKRPDIDLVACIGRSSAGKRLGDAVDVNLESASEIVISDSVENALGQASFSVLIDYTTPASVYKTVMAGIKNRLHCVIGTSGLSNVQFREIDAAAKEHDVGAMTANFSITATLMMHFAQIAAKWAPHWEIMDYASDGKIDAPSGTARELAFLLSKAGTPGHAIRPEDVHGHPESRGFKLDGSQVHAVRLPGYYSSVETIFGLPGQRISIRHDSMSDAPYVEGTLLAAKEISTHRGLIRGMAPLLNL